MEISFLGAGGIKLSGKQITILCDPAGTKTKLPVDVVILSGPAGNLAVESGMVVDGPGEYEIKEAQVTGVPARLHIDSDPDATGLRGTIYSIELDGVNVAFLGNIAPGLSNEQLEQLGQVDVLAVPVGGHGLTLDATAAAQLISQIEPKYVVPTHYNDGKTTYDVPQDDLSKFTAEMGIKPEPIAKLKVNPKEMPIETTVVVLQA